jgi:purine-binding chemotaxis protein CheW
LQKEYWSSGLVAFPVLLFVVVLDRLRIALPLDVVERAVPACELTPLPDAPLLVAGAFNLHGQAVAVLDLRRRLGLATRPAGLGDQLVLVAVHGRRMALLVDEAEGVVEYPADALVPGAALAEGAPLVPGLITVHDGLLLVEEPARFLDSADLSRLDKALDPEGRHGR